VRLSQAQYQCIFGHIVRLEGLAKAAEDLFVLLRVFLGQDYESRGAETMPQTVQAAALFAFIGFGSALETVAPVGFALSF
jgi:hypothetical protein